MVLADEQEVDRRPALCDGWTCCWLLAWDAASLLLFLTMASNLSFWWITCATAIIPKKDWCESCFPKSSTMSSFKWLVQQMVWSYLQMLSSWLNSNSGRPKSEFIHANYPPSCTLAVVESDKDLCISPFQTVICIQQYDALSNPIPNGLRL